MAKIISYSVSSLLKLFPPGPALAEIHKRSYKDSHEKLKLFLAAKAVKDKKATMAYGLNYFILLKLSAKAEIILAISHKRSYKES